MLRNDEHGYAVMSKELDSFSFEHIDLETCKKYCRNGDVIARRITFKSGINISFNWYKPHKCFEFKRRLRQMNIGWLNVAWNYNYLHRTGEVIYSS